MIQFFWVITIVVSAGVERAYGGCQTCDAKANVLVVFDRSTSALGGPGIMKEEFESAKTFLKDVFNGLNLGPNGIVTSFIDYSSSPVVRHDYDDPASTDISMIEANIDSIPKPKGNSNIHKAFDEARLNVAPTAPARSRACNVTLIITDGQFEDDELAVTAMDAYQNVTNSRCCVVEFRKRSSETESQMTYRDARLQDMKGDSGLLIGTNLFTYPLAVGNAIHCICNSCSFECSD